MKKSIYDFLLKKNLGKLINFLLMIKYLFRSELKIKFHSADCFEHINHVLNFYDYTPISNFNIENIEKEVNKIYFYKYIPKDGDICIDIGAGVGGESFK